MKLYTFLLIDNELISDEKLFTQTESTRKYPSKNGYVGLINGTAKRNRIYIYKYINDEGEVEELALMSFKYPNTEYTQVTDGERYDWAYVILDKTEPIGGTTLIDAKYGKQRWGSNKDKLGDIYKFTAAVGDGIEIIRTKRLKYGGHIGNTKVSKNMDTLHKYVYQPDNFNNDKERIHHKGHTFDNRRKYLMRMSRRRHIEIHTSWEKKHGYQRTKLETIKDGRRKRPIISDAILIIKTKEQFEEFIAQLNSPEYIAFENDHIYDDTRRKK